MSNTPQTEPVSDFMERHFAHLRDGRKEYTEAEVRSIMMAMEANMRTIDEDREALREEVRRLDATLADEFNNRDVLDKMLTQCITERDQLRAQLAKAVVEEREACKRTCMDIHKRNESAFALECALAIEARSNT